MEDEFIGKCGLTEYCLEFINLALFINFPEIDLEVRSGEKIGSVESDNVLYDIITPVSGLIVEINRNLERAPEIINTDPLGSGWIFKIDVKEPNELRDMMNTTEYKNFIVDEGSLR